MHSPEQHRQLGALQNLRQVRRSQTIYALQRALAALKAIEQSLADTEQALVALEDERVALFEAHRGMTHRGGLLTLRRRASEIEMRRIHLAITRVQLKADAACALRAESAARSAVLATQRQYDKLEHIAHLWRRDSQIHLQRLEEDAA